MSAHSNRSLRAGGLSPRAIVRSVPARSVSAQEFPLGSLAGVGPKRARALAERGLISAADALLHIPIRYEDWRVPDPPDRLAPGKPVLVKGELVELKQRTVARGRWQRVITGWIVVGAQEHRLRVVWFNAPPYLLERLAEWRTVLVRGRLGRLEDGTLEIQHPDLQPANECVAIRPIYRVPDSVGQRLFAKLLGDCLDRFGDSLPGAIPSSFRERLSLPTLGQALHAIHRPSSDIPADELLTAHTASHRALVMEELFTFEVALCLERRRLTTRAGIAMAGQGARTAGFLTGLQFPLTSAQLNAIKEIERDMARPHPMNRLLLGDVGSGKTVVALWAALRAVENHHQAVMMAPTELLAEQHYQTFMRLASKPDVRAALLTSRLAGASRKALARDLASGDLQIAFGTQALLSEDVKVPRLGLAIVDEQHRFGVFQRARLKALGASCDMLLMTATPIPRSLAMALLSNLDVSVLDQVPTGRAGVTTEVVEEDHWDEIVLKVQNEIVQGGRAYVIVPRVEAEQEQLAIASVASRLRAGVLHSARIATLHGRMPAPEKDAAMRAFRDGATDLLVCTTVVEVGIDVPEATAAVITAAERYGLAQIHQLRGRVGRGERPGRCWLICSDQCDAAARSRLERAAACRTGEEIAQADLEMRGPGDLLGSRQSGPLPLRFAHLLRDIETIEQARQLAEEWLDRDPDLEDPQSAPLHDRVRDLYEAGFSLGDIG